MKLSTTFLALLVSATGLVAASSHNAGLTARHARAARRSEAVETPVIRKRCKARPNSTKAAPAAAETPKDEPKKDEPKTPDVKDDKPKPVAVVKPVEQNWSDVINVKSECGDIRASKTTTALSGPNGHIDWLNCGINDDGWRPPFIQISELKTVSLSDSLKDPNSPFHACTNFLGFFESFGAEFGIPPIMLASFAMQESSCKPDTVGGGGEQGLMQLTHDKCGKAPGGNCRDPAFNIRTGAEFFAGVLSKNKGGVLESIGQYNGWSVGLTFAKATAAADSSCCRCQNNLDYLHQYLNGWIRGISAYSDLKMGKYDNLSVCK